MTTEARMIYMTTGTPAEAENITRTLVTEKLCACGNIFPVHSIYSWKEKIEEETETAVILKTKNSLVESCINRIKELHSYDVPCIVVYEIENGFSPYLKWIDNVTT